MLAKILKSASWVLLLVVLEGSVMLKETTQPDLVLEQPGRVEVLLPALIPICACESTGRKDGTPTHYDKNGNVLRGKINPHDIGICQINEDYNGKTAEQMGLNIYKEQDNIKFANHMYSTQGSQPWAWSKNCWK